MLYDKHNYNTHIIYLFLSYRIEHAMSNNMLRNINLKNKLLIFESLVCAVHIHRQAMKFVFIPQYVGFIVIRNISYFSVLKIVQTFAIEYWTNDVLFNNIWSSLGEPQSVSSRFSVLFNNLYYWASIRHFITYKSIELRTAITWVVKTIH